MASCVVALLLCAVDSSAALRRSLIVPCPHYPVVSQYLLYIYVRHIRESLCVKYLLCLILNLIARIACIGRFMVSCKKINYRD